MKTSDYPGKKRQSKATLCWILHNERYHKAWYENGILYFKPRHSRNPRMLRIEDAFLASTEVKPVVKPAEDSRKIAMPFVVTAPGADADSQPANPGMA